MKRIEFKFLLLVFLCFSILSDQDSFSISKNLDMPTKGICAHRGAMETHPENTIAAFKEAIRLGAQMIEFDVQLTKDNELVIIHDNTIDRTTNGAGLVHMLTLAEIRTFDAGSWKSKQFADEKVPKLKEVLQIMPQNIWLNIHLKGSKKLGKETAKLLISEKKLHQAIVACEKEAAIGVNEIDSRVKICNMERLSSRSKYIDSTIKHGYGFIQLKKSRDDEFFNYDIQKLKRHNIQINYVKADSKEEVSKLLEYGIDFILTDRLADMLDAFSEVKQSQPIY